MMNRIVFCVLFLKLYSATAFTPYVNTLAGGDAEGYVDGGGTDVRFRNPTAIDVTPDDAYALICDRSNHVIRAYSINEDAVQTLAGNADEEGDVDAIRGLDARFKQPYSVKAHPGGAYALIVDPYTKSIRMLNMTFPYAVSTVASGFLWPTSIAISRDGTFAAITDRNSILLMDLATYAIETLAGVYAEGNSMGVGTDASFKQPAGIAIAPDDSMLYVIDYNNHHIRSVTIPGGDAQRYCGQLTSSATQNNGECLTEANTDELLDIVYPPDDSYLLVTDAESNTLRMINTSTGVISTFIGTGAAESRDGTFAYASFNRPNSVAFTSDSATMLIVTDDDKLRCVQLREPDIPMLFCVFPATPEPTSTPSLPPSSTPTAIPSSAPTSLPTSIPTTATPTSIPTSVPSASPSVPPTSIPSSIPTSTPSASPSAPPTSIPSSMPSSIPTSLPSAIPSGMPTSAPTLPTSSSSASAAAIAAARAGRVLLPILVGLAVLCCCCFVVAARRRKKREEEKKVNPYELNDDGVGIEASSTREDRKIVSLEP